LNPKSRGLENLAAFFHRHAGADRIIYEDDRLVWVDLPFDQLQRTVLFAFLADQQAAVPAAGLQDAGLNDRHGGQTVGRDLAAIKVAEELQYAPPGKAGPP